jgi:hypothetical protein
MPMKLKVQHLMDATMVLKTIINEDRAMPQKGKYRIARMHDKLGKEFEIINKQHFDMIKAYGQHAMIPNPAAAHITDDMREAMIASGHLDKVPPKMIEDTNNYQVPAEHLEEYTKQWNEIVNQEIEVDVQPLPLNQIAFPGDLEDGSISAHEFIILGDLVVE